MSYRICLVRPGPQRRKEIFDTYEPLNLLFLGTYLKNSGCQVKIIDEYLDEDVVSEIEKFKPDLVGLTALTFTYPRAVTLMRKIKALGYLTIIGGVHASARPEAAIADGFDMVVVGEGEEILLDVLQKGIRQGILSISKEYALKEYKWLPLDRSLVNMEAYCREYKRKKSNRGSKVRVANLITSLGCAYKCIFCHNSLSPHPLRLMNAGMIIEEIEKLIADFHIENLDFCDDDFFINRPRAVNFCELMIKKNMKITWTVLTRPSSLDEDFIKLAVRSGCKRMSFGFESGSQRILDILGKQASVEQNEKIARLCKKHGLEVSAFMIVGSPGETAKEIDLTWKFIKRVKPDNIGLSVLIPFPGTILWKECQEKGLIPENVDFSTFYFHAPIQIPDTFSPRKVELIRLILQMKSYLFIPSLRKNLFRYIFTQPLAGLSNFLESLQLAF